MPPIADSLQLSCPAKVNLALSVGAADAALAGLHPLASWMVAVNFGDRLTLTKSAGPSRFDIGAEPSQPDLKIDWPLEKDLAYRAHAALEQHIGQALPVELSIIKHIAPGAGLGGGSSNAASVLVGLNRLFDLGLHADTLSGLGHQLGSDVPFLVGAALGAASAVVTGLGESVEPAPRPQAIHLVLVLAPFGCSTAAVYGAFDKLADQSKQADVGRVRELANTTPLSPEAPFNELAQPACRVEPRLAQLQQQLAQQLPAPVHITGSGSTLFVVGRDAADCEQLARTAAKACGLPAIAVATL